MVCIKQFSASGSGRTEAGCFGGAITTARSYVRVGDWHSDSRLVFWESLPFEPYPISLGRKRRWIEYAIMSRS